MNTPLFSLLVCLIAFPLSQAQAQAAKDIDKKYLRSLNKVEVFSNDNKFPISRLYRIDKTYLTVVKDVNVPFVDETVAFQKFPLDNIDKIRVYNKRERKKAMLLCGIGTGLAAYFITNELVDKNKGRSSGLDALGQTPQSGFFEPIVAGTMGLALGIAFAEWIYPIDLDFKRKRRQSIRRLKYELGSDVTLK